MDLIFDALANERRREIIYSLSLHPLSISQLATMQDLSLPAIHKHIKLLENAGIIKRKKSGRVNFLTLNPSSLRGLQDWLFQFHAYWDSGAETLENYARTIQYQNKLKNKEKK